MCATAVPHNTRAMQQDSNGKIMLIIKGGRVMTMAGKEYPQGDVLIEDGKIAAVGENIGAEDAEVLDVKGMWVMPGLVEAHCHIGITEERKGIEGNDCNETANPITPYLRALDAINPMDYAFHKAVKAGITTVMVGPGSSNVVGGQFAVLKTHARSIDKMLVLAPAAMKVAFGENPKSQYGGKNMLPSTRMTVCSMLREELYVAQDYCRRRAAAEEKVEDFTKDFEKECWVPVFKKEIPLKAHVHRADDILTAIRIAKEFDLDMTLDHCTEGHLIAKEIQESGFPAILGPNLATRDKIETQFSDFKTAGVLHKSGVLVAVMTDHPVSGIQYLAKCAGFSAKEGLGVGEGLKAITINAAKILRVADRVGSIEVGKDADIAVFDKNPMETFAETLYTVINGEIAYKYTDRDFT